MDRAAWGSDCHAGYRKAVVERPHHAILNLGAEVSLRML